MNKFFTDLASEILPQKPRLQKISEGVSRFDAVVTEQDSVLYMKDAGRYTTLELDGGCIENEASEALRRVLDDFLPSAGNALVVGLGNDAMIADSLGARTASRIVVTRHMEKELKALGAGCVSCVCPSVLGVTGIPSFDLIKCAVQCAKPSAVICIDSLAGRRVERLGKTIQITDTGIAPGSGLGLRHNKINRQTLGVPVIALGVPLVMYAKTIVREAMDALDVDMDNEKILALNNSVGELVVTPKEIDIYITRMSKIIALGTNLYLHPKMKRQDLNCLMYGS